MSEGATMFGEKSPKASPARKTLRLIGPLVLAGAITLALIAESSARGFGMHAIGGMRATNYRAVRPNTIRMPRNTGRYSGRISRTRGDGYQGRTSGRYPGKIYGGKIYGGKIYGGRGGDGGKVAVSHDPGRWRYPRYPRPGWRYPIVTPIIPLTPGPTTITTTGVPPTINQAATPPGGQGPNQPGGPNGQRAGFNPPPPGETRFVPNEVLLNVAADVTTPTLDAIARRNRLTRLELREFSMTGRRIARLRINDRRPVATVIRSLQAEGSIAGAQPNYLFALNQASAPAADPTQ